MKIPETPANVGAYYGNEENGQWQPNGVLIDSGVGGGVVGSGDAGVHRPPVYPLHIPRGHIPGYVMAGAYYPPAPYPVPAAPAPQPDDFEDYMWMENEEEFDKQVMQQLEEEALMEQCIEAMLDDERRDRLDAREARANGHKHCPTTSNGNPLSLEETVSRSTLNPLAAEFVPTFTPRPAPPVQPVQPVQPAPPATEEHKEEKPALAEAPSPPAPAAPAPAVPAALPELAVEENATQTRLEQTQDTTDAVAEDKSEEAVSPTESSEASEVSADKRPKDQKKDVKKDTKKPIAKVETKPKVKPSSAKPEPKPAAKRRDAPAPDALKPQPTPVEESTPSVPGIKPINYAAAARANKPKPKPTAPAAPTAAPAQDKATPPTKSDRKATEKIQPKEKVVQRKNSAK